MKKAFAIPVLGIPVLLFLISRMTSFFSEVWGVHLPVIVGGGIVLAGVALLFVFRKKCLEFLESSAYGFSNIAITIYLLSICVCIKYSGVVLNGCANRNMACVAGGGILLGLFVLVLATALIKGRLCKPFETASKARWGWVLIVAAVLLNLQAVLYCKFMKDIFVWDNAGYFVTVHRLNDLFPSFEYFKAVYKSVFETDYNYIIALPASLMCKLFGESRLVFILAIVNFYLLPTVMLIYVIARRFFGRGMLAIPAVLALPYLAFATNTGFIDIGGVFFALIAVMLFLWCENDELCAVSGALLAVCVLLRRWYSFYAVSFIIASVVWGISRKKIKGSVFTTLSFAFVLLFFAQPFVSGKLMADYKYMYSAYALGAVTDIRLFARYFGVILTVAISVWAVRCQVMSKLKLTPEFFMWLQGIICFGMFASLQTHGQQHLALYVPMFTINVLSICAAAFTVKKAVVALVWVLCGVNTVSVFVPRVQPKSIKEIKGASLLPTFSAYPPVDENAESFVQVTEFMDGEIGLKGKTVCFLASSVEMNYDTLRNAEISLSIKKKYDINRESYYLTIGDVDKRDGLAESLFAADYILVPSTLQIHLAPEEQRIISVPYEHITKGTGIGEAYEKQKTKFTLKSGDEIYLYKKIREVTPEEKEELKKEIFGE